MAMAYPWYSPRGFAVLALFALALCLAIILRKPTRRLPPGPKRRLIVGNLLQIPKTFAWIQYKTWSVKHGDVISLEIFNKVIVVLNSYSAAEGLCHKSRSNGFPNRPPIKFAEMTGMQDRNVIFTSGKKCRDRRRIADRTFRPAAIQAYQSVAQERAIITLRRLAQDPGRFAEHVREYAGAVMLSILYDYDVKDRTDPILRVAEEYNYLVKRSLLPGALLVNSFPFLGRLPPWMLGSRFSWLLQRVKDISFEANNAPFNWTKRSMEKGTARLSIVREALTELGSPSEEVETMYKEAFSVSYIAGSDSTVVALTNFILAMLLHPAAQAKAQAEIDAIVGRDRLPAFGDRPNLPYVDALIMEVLRWSPVSPQAFPHMVDEDVQWGDYVIPKGAMVLCNVWAIAHDPDAYTDPEAFIPERYLSPDGKVVDDPRIEYVFGYGARRCPGRHFADTIMWILVVTVLAEFTIAKREGAEEVVAGNTHLGQGLNNCPRPFECDIRPRGAQALQVLETL